MNDRGALFLVALITACGFVQSSGRSSGQSPVSPAPGIDRMRADNAVIAPDGKRGTEDLYRLPGSPQQLVFEFGDPQAIGRDPVQLRYRLDGRDEDWRDLVGNMRFQVRFIDANNQPVDGEESSVAGRSPGWTGQIETSPFQHRSKRITVPPRAAKLMLWMISAGPQETDPLPKS